MNTSLCDNKYMYKYVALRSHHISGIKRNSLVFISCLINKTDSVKFAIKIQRCCWNVIQKSQKRVCHMQEIGERWAWSRRRRDASGPCFSHRFSSVIFLFFYLYASHKNVRRYRTRFVNSSSFRACSRYRYRMQNGRRHDGSRGETVGRDDSSYPQTMPQWPRLSAATMLCARAYYLSNNPKRLA